jgi:hypothetical protein
VLNDEVALLNLDRSFYYCLNGTGALIWNRLHEPRPVSDLCEHVLAHFDVSAETCREDVLRFLKLMYEAGLIETVA